MRVITAREIPPVTPESVAAALQAAADELRRDGLQLGPDGRIELAVQTSVRLPVEQRSALGAVLERLRERGYTTADIRQACDLLDAAEAGL